MPVLNWAESVRNHLQRIQISTNVRDRLIILLMDVCALRKASVGNLLRRPPAGSLAMMVAMTGMLTYYIERVDPELRSSANIGVR